MKSVRLLSLLAVAFPVLAGCAASVEPIDVGAGCPEMPLRGPTELAVVPPERVIDDFEDGDLKLTAIDGRAGSWIGGATMGATPVAEASTRCVARGTHSGHLTSLVPSSAVQSYLANWNAVLIDPFINANAWDASAYSGFSFWIAAGANALPPLETPIGVITTDTAAGGGVCTQCGDYYAIRKRIPLTRAWTRWVVRFSDLAQYGFGVPQVALNKSHLVSIIIWPESQFDIWIDDLRFEP